MERGYTKIGKNNVVYEWKIDDMDILLNTEIDFTLTSQFTSGAKTNDTWRIKSIFGSKDNVYFYLCLISDHYELKTKFSFFVLDSKKQKVFITKYQKLISKSEGKYFSLIKKDLLDNKDKYLPNNTLTVCLDLTVYSIHTTALEKLIINSSKRGITHDYEELYNNKMGCDTIINVGDKEFQAHKTILMARSPVLAAMFSHDMIEKKENKISIPDITPETFEKVLKYIYTDEITDLDADAERLLEAADKYQLQSLKEMCQESLSGTLSVDNALKIMTLADRHSAKELLEFTIDYMASKIKDIIVTEDFKDLEKSNVTEAFGLIKKLSSHK